ncbi:MAG TPA: hypothetical protein VNN19_00815, partial [bacterium]|nr:hypothetical protein [bacterium]
MSRSPIAARLLVPALVALTLAGCAVRRPPSPESTRQLRVAAVRRVVDQPALSPAVWSPDGRRFAYAAAGGVYVVVPEQPPQPIAPARVPTELAWSARLDLLAVVDGGAVWVMRPDGAGRHRLDLPGFA